MLYFDMLLSFGAAPGWPVTDDLQLQHPTGAQGHVDPLQGVAIYYIASTGQALLCLCALYGLVTTATIRDRPWLETFIFMGYAISSWALKGSASGLACLGCQWPS